MTKRYKVRIQKQPGEKQKLEDKCDQPHMTMGANRPMSLKASKGKTQREARGLGGHWCSHKLQAHDTVLYPLTCAERYFS